MKTTQTLIATEKHPPSEAELISHQLMIRAGLIRKLASGIYSWLPTGLKVLRKIENIVHQEMKTVNASEVLLPNILPAELLKETHRWDKFGPDLLKMKDRHNRDFYYGPTHEESIVDIIRKELKSYKQLPLNIYQVQTKFRDEVRPRYGVMRAREFIMKDAYSFHINKDCLQKTYDSMFQVYTNILKRIGLEFRAVQADSGAIGGNHSHEFQVLAQSGEDIICYSDDSVYAANIELAQYKIPDLNKRNNPSQELEMFETIDICSIKNLIDTYSFDIKKLIKTLVYKDNTNKYYAFILRGDHTFNEIKAQKIKQVSGEKLIAASTKEIEYIFKTPSGYLGPVISPIDVIVDYSAAMLNDFICGANQNGKHYKGVNWDRDVINYSVADIRNVQENDIVPDGSGLFKKCNGIEVGHIFQLGDVYSKAMKASVLDQNGKSKSLIMGCYGFGISRLIAATIEQCHDDLGIIWPKSITPYQVIIIPINMHKDSAVKDFTFDLYDKLCKHNIEVLFDDRKERPGVMFSDADLIGAPHQIIVSSKHINDNKIEYKSRLNQEKEILTYEQLLLKL